MNVDVEQMEQVVDAPGRYHQAGVNGAPDDPPQRVPSPLVEPIQEVVETMFDHIGRGAIIKPENKRNRSRLRGPRAQFYVTSLGLPGPVLTMGRTRGLCSRSG